MGASGQAVDCTEVPTESNGVCNTAEPQESEVSNAAKQDRRNDKSDLAGKVLQNHKCLRQISVIL